MRAHVTVDMDNDAFVEDAGSELARILRRLADKVDGSGIQAGEAVILDRNGNRVGELRIDA